MVFCDYFNLTNISTNGFKAITSKLLQLIRDKNDSSISNNKYSKEYYIFSFIYVFSAFITFVMGCVYSIAIIQNRQYVVETLKNIVLNFKNNNFINAFSNLNNIFVYVLPLIFIMIMVLKILLKILKGVVSNNDRVEKHK